MKKRFLVLLCFAAVLAGGIGIATSSVAYADDFTVMRENLRREVFLGPLDYDVTDPDIQSHISAIVQNATTYQNSLVLSPTTYLWSDYNKLTGDASYTCKHIYYSLGRLHTMALAWAYPTSSLYHDTTLLYNIKHSLDFLYGYCLNENTALLGNFWEWRIGMPQEYAAIVSILYEQLTPVQIDHYDKAFTNFVRYFAKHGNLTFANQADICRNLLYMGILTGNVQDIQDALAYVKRAFVDETTIAQRKAAQQKMEQMLQEQGDYHNYSGILKKEGLYEDGTFIQHTAIPYIGSYGASMAHFAAQMQLCFAGTEDYAATPWFYDIMPVWIEKAYIPAIYKGEMMRMFMGRNVNSAHSSHEAARELGLDIYLCSTLINDLQQRQRVIKTCNSWFADNAYYSSPYQGLDPIIRRPQVERMQAAAASVASNVEADMGFNKVFAAGDRVIHETTKFRLGIAMSSCRIGKFEGFSSNNMSGWYTGDGMTYIYTPNNRDHWLRFFNSCNYYRMPGTTVDKIAREADGANIALFDNPANAQHWVGGVSLCGRYGAAGMSHVGAKSDLVAKKAWFMFDDEVVCLGAGISMSENRGVETIVESRAIDKGFTVDGEAGTTRKCVEASYTNPTYAYINEVGGYYFPKPCTLCTYIEQNKYISFYFSHGKAPQNADYVYILLPQMTEQEVVSYAGQSPVRILTNTDSVQGVWHTTLDIVGVNFYSAGECAGVGSDGEASLMYRHSGDTLYLAVSDPTWQRTSQQLVLDGVYSLLSAEPQGVATLTSNTSQTVVTINCADRMGQGADLMLLTQQRMPDPEPQTPTEEVANDDNGKSKQDGRKFIRKGQVLIDGKNNTYNAIGQKIK